MQDQRHAHPSAHDTCAQPHSSVADTHTACAHPHSSIADTHAACAHSWELQQLVLASSRLHQLSKQLQRLLRLISDAAFSTCALAAKWKLQCCL